MAGAPRVDFAPEAPEFVADPYPVYAELRARHPIFRARSDDLTYFTRYADIARLLQDQRFGRSMDHMLPRAEVDARRRAARWDALPNYSRYVRVNLMEQEGAEHARLRGILSKLVNPMRARGLHARIQGLVDELLGAVLARGEADFIAELAEPLPVHVIADWLGWPREERQRLRPWSAAIVRLYEADHDAADEVRAEAAVCEFAAMMQTLIEARHAQPRHDLISALVALEDEPEGLSRDELIATCMLVLNAGHEATVNAAGNGLLALLRHPAQMERLRAEAALMHSAVEELLRYDSPLQLFRRFALEDLAYGGVAIARGEQVGLLYGSANRDGAAFEHADALNLARRPNVHLAFGGGKHYCIGAPLARLELQLLYGALLQRMPKLELDEPMPPRRPGHVFRGLRRLRVRW